MVQSAPAAGHAPALSICICTLDRDRLLVPTLGRLTQLEVPDGLGFEVVLVDNCPRQSAKALAQAFTARLPLTYVEEPRLGLSIARNRALEVSRGDLVIWTDDDVLVPSGWLKAYLAGARAYPDAPCFGGAIQPVLQGAPPRWLVEGLAVLGSAYAQRDQLADGAVLAGPDLPYGANFAFRRAAAAGLRFDEALGWRGAGGVYGEETEFLKELVRRHGPGRWLQGTAVQHIIPPSRQSWTYLRNYYRKVGRFHRTDPEVAKSAHLWGRPRFAYRRAAQSGLRMLARRWSHPPAVWLEDWKNFWIAMGSLSDPPPSGGA